MNYKSLPSIINNFIVIQDLGIKKRRHYLLAKCKKCLRIFETTKDHVARNTIGCSRACAKYKGGNKRLAKIREGMIARCHNRNHVSFVNYSINNITVCNEWLNNSTSFYKWALANGYKDDLTLDRVDNTKGYFPENCRWSNKHIQSQNSSQTKLDETKVKEILTLAKSMPQKDIAKLYNVSRSTICSIVKGIRWSNILREN